jgi:hypothetical protein
MVWNVSMRTGVTRNGRHSKNQKSKGAERLSEYIRANHRTVPAFCAANGLDRVAIKRLMDGERGARMSVDFASRIATATRGFVAITDWIDGASEPAKADTEGPVVVREGFDQTDDRSAA